MQLTRPIRQQPTAQNSEDQKRPERNKKRSLKKCEPAVRRMVANCTSALAHVCDKNRKANCIVWLNQSGVAWNIAAIWKATSSKVMDRMNRFLKDRPQTKAIDSNGAPTREGRKPLGGTAVCRSLVSRVNESTS